MREAIEIGRKLSDLLESGGSDDATSNLYISVAAHPGVSKVSARLSWGRQAVSFPGYTVITPPWEDESANSTFYTNLKACQQQLLQPPIDAGLIVPVPPESFHLTVADLIWDSAYRHASEKPDFDEQLHSAIAQSFEQCKPSISGGNEIHWQLLGLIIMPRAIAVALVPKDEGSYERILRFRRAIYQNPALIALGIEQQYRFTAHITLGYFGDISPQLDREHLCNTLSQINEQWLENSQEFWVNRAELRKFDDMTRYYRDPDW